MSEIGKVIKNVLENDANVISLLPLNEKGDARNIHPNHANYKESLPLIIYTIEDVDPTNDKDGVSTLDTVSFDITTYADGYSDLVTLSGYIRTALDGYSATNSGVVVQRISFINYEDQFDQQAEKPLTIQEFQARIIL